MPPSVGTTYVPPRADRTNDALHLELRVDSRNRGRAHFNGLEVLVGIADYVEFFRRDLLGNRNRIFDGPWNSRVIENSPGDYTLTGNDPISGAAYSIGLTQVDASTIAVLFRFTLPSEPCELGFDVVKVSGDLFLGAHLESAPASMSDASVVTMEPLPHPNTTLVRNKNWIRVRGTFCDIEITDSMNRKTLYAADGRDLPWDKRKSIIIAAQPGMLRAGTEYTFKYVIKCLEPTSAKKIYSVTSRECVNHTDPWQFYNPPAKKEVEEFGVFPLTTDTFIAGVPGRTAEAILAREIHAMTSLSVPVRTKNLSEKPGAIVIERISDGRLPAEAFELDVSPTRIVIRGPDERGCLYGAYALMGRLRRDNGQWQFGCVRMGDWPDLSLRGACIELLRPAVRDVQLMKRYLDVLSKARANTVLFLHDPVHVRSWLHKKDDGGWTKEQVREIVEYARWLHMDVWGGMGSAFDPQKFPEMTIRNGSNIYDPSDEKNYRALFALYGEILSTYEPTIFLIGRDEIQGLSVYAALSGDRTAEILASDVKKIYTWLGARGIRTALWGDMLLDSETWERKVGSAHGGSPRFDSGETHRALPLLPRDIFILDWHYRYAASYDSIAYFRKQGFRVAGTSWHDPKAAQSFARSVKQYGGYGMFLSDWGFWSTLSPAATTLYTLLCAWSLQCGIDSTDNDTRVFAESLRAPMYARTFGHHTPIELRRATGRVTEFDRGRPSRTTFGIGTFLDAQQFQKGKQRIGGILFDLSGGEGENPSGAVIVSNAGDRGGDMQRSLKVHVGGAKASALAFLHTAFIEEPSMTPMRLGTYVVTYVDGRSETIDIVTNWNITDIRSGQGVRKNAWAFTRRPDVLIGAKTAWCGYSLAGVPLNMQLFLWSNPHPDRAIERITLSIGDEVKGAQIALVGITLLE